MKKEFTFRQIASNLNSDIIVLIISLMLFLIPTIVISFSVTDSLSDGVIIGFWSGLILSSISFYFFRGQFNFWWTIIQLTIHVTLSILLFLGLLFLLENFYEITFPVPVLLITGIILLTMICLIKQVLDNIGNSLGLERRTKKSIDMIK